MRKRRLERATRAGTIHDHTNPAVSTAARSSGTALIAAVLIAALIGLTGCGPTRLGASPTATDSTAAGTTGPGSTTEPGDPDVASTTTGPPTTGPAAVSGPAKPFTQASARPAYVEPTPAGSGVLIDQDNFDGTRLDPARWQIYNADATNGISRWTPDMVRVTGGELQITGTGRNPTGAGNVSGGVAWRYGQGEQTYGRWQVRARFDTGVGYGQAVLLWPKSENWPADGELDFVETPTATKRTANGTVHWGTSSAPQEDTKALAGDFSGWHIYTLDWQPSYVRMYVDNQLMYDSTKTDNPPVIPDTPMSLALQQEPGPFGDNWVPAPTSATPDQVVMHIDWVRLYR
jgi:endo-1,3-1,4-beta-glycanase ExoK